MTIGIIGVPDQKEALPAAVDAAGTHMLWLDQPFPESGIDAVIDFSGNTVHYPERWYETSDTLLFINLVEEVPVNWPAHFIRFNGWPGCWQRPLLEATCQSAPQRARAELIMDQLGKKIEWVPDLPGFLSARVLATIINEAYLSLEEGVSSKEDIDTAMKLGTNYPFGPFEWGEKIGIERICRLLNKMATDQPQYQPSRLLTKEAGV